MVMPHTPLRFGIIGFGNFAERTIAPALRATPGVSLTAIQKRSLDAARAKAAEHNIPRFYAAAEDLAADPDVDAVFIVSANATHCAETIAAARAGKHVIVEKPMAMDVREAEEMIAICARQNVRLMVAHMIRFSPMVHRMREVVHSGILGKLVYARADFVYDGRLSRRDWLRDRVVAGGGPVFDIGVHCLDTLRFVLDDEVQDVRAVLNPSPSASRTEETAQLGLRFAGGTIGSIFCSYEAPVRRKEIEIMGLEGRMTAGEFTVGDVTAQLHVDTSTDSRPEKPRVETFQVPNLYIKEISHFVDAVRTGSPLVTPGENGLANQRVLDRALAETR